jgi:hypothetical protein
MRSPASSGVGRGRTLHAQDAFDGDSRDSSRATTRAWSAGLRPAAMDAMAVPAPRRVLHRHRRLDRVSDGNMDRFWIDGQPLDREHAT